MQDGDLNFLRPNQRCRLGTKNHTPGSASECERDIDLRSASSGMRCEGVLSARAHNRYLTHGTNSLSSHAFAAEAYRVEALSKVPVRGFQQLGLPWTLHAAVSRNNGASMARLPAYSLNGLRMSNLPTIGLGSLFPDRLAFSTGKIHGPQTC